MPFKNPKPNRKDIAQPFLMPIQSRNSDFAFRVWMFNSRSLDRIITIFNDSLNTPLYGFVVEYGWLYKGRANGKKYKEYFYSSSDLMPKNGYKQFIDKMRQLGMMSLKSQPEAFNIKGPYSIYVVEVKDHDKFNTFKFMTFYPQSGVHDPNYDAIEKLIFDEYDFIKSFQDNIHPPNRWEKVD